jgi:hypothetical protein
MLIDVFARVGQHDFVPGTFVALFRTLDDSQLILFLGH